MQPNRTALREEFSAVGPPACVGSRRRPRGDAADARQGRSVVSGSLAISAAMCRSNRLVHGWLPTVDRPERRGTSWPGRWDRVGSARWGTDDAAVWWSGRIPRRQGAPADGDRGGLRRRSTWSRREGRCAGDRSRGAESAESPVRTAAHELDFGARSASKMLSIRTFSARISAFKSRWTQVERQPRPRPRRSRRSPWFPSCPAPEELTEKRPRPPRDGPRPHSVSGVQLGRRGAPRAVDPTPRREHRPHPLPRPAHRPPPGCEQAQPGSRTVNRQTGVAVVHVIRPRPPHCSATEHAPMGIR